MCAFWVLFYQPGVETWRTQVWRGCAPVNNGQTFSGFEPFGGLTAPTTPTAYSHTTAPAAVPALLHAVEMQDASPYQKANPYYTHRVRVRLGLAYAITLYFDISIPKAIEAVWDDAVLGECPPNADRHAGNWWDRLDKTAGVEDAQRGSRSKKLSDDWVQEVAVRVMAGYVVRTTKGINKRMFYHTLAEALEHMDDVRELLLLKDISKQHLLKRMHDMMPNLKWGRSDMKRELSTAQKEARRTCAAWYLNQHRNNPNFLQDVIMIDEVKVWFFGGDEKDVTVWYDAHSAEAHMVVPGC